MKYQEFRAWAEKQDWLLVGKAEVQEIWLTPSGRPVDVRMYPHKTDIEIYLFEERHITTN